MTWRTEAILKVVQLDTAEMYLKWPKGSITINVNTYLWLYILRHSVFVKTCVTELAVFCLRKKEKTEHHSSCMMSENEQIGPGWYLDVRPPGISRCELTCKKNLKKTICEVSSISDTKRLLHLHKVKILKFQWRLSLRPCCCSLMSVDGSTRAEV